MIRYLRIISFYLGVIILTVFSIGCEDSMMKMIPPTDPPTKPPTQRAKDAMEIVNQRRTESLKKAKAAADYLIVFTDSELILHEELGFRKAFWVELVDIYKDEKREDSTVMDGFASLENSFAKRLADDTFGMFYFEYIRTFDPLIIEYLRLSYVYPTEDEAALLARFRNSINDEKAPIIFPVDF